MRLLMMRPTRSEVLGFEDVDKFEDDPDGNFPRYAALSHTWGHKTETMGVRKIDCPISSRRKHLLGMSRCYAGNQQSSVKSSAIFWIDTCCIDKGSSNELGFAIETMSRHYPNTATRGEESHSESSMLELITIFLASGKQYDLPIRTDRIPLGSLSTCSNTSSLNVLSRVFTSIPTNEHQAAVSFIWQNDTMWNQ